MTALMRRSTGANNQINSGSFLCCCFGLWLIVHLCRVTSHVYCYDRSHCTTAEAHSQDTGCNYNIWGFLPNIKMHSGKAKARYRFILHIPQQGDHGLSVWMFYRRPGGYFPKTPPREYIQMKHMWLPTGKKALQLPGYCLLHTWVAGIDSSQMWPVRISPINVFILQS